MEDLTDENIVAQSVEEAIFFLNESKYTVLVEDDSLRLTCVETKGKKPSSSFDKSICLLNVISTSCGEEQCRVDRKGKPVFGNKLFSLFTNSTTCYTLSIHFSRNLRNHVKRLETLKLFTHKEKDCNELHTRIEKNVFKILQKHAQVRPKKLLVFVNPFCGTKTAESIHRKVMTPLLNLAKVEQTVVLTRYNGFADEYIKLNDLSRYDGVIAIGGDGTFSEVANAVVLDQQMKMGIPVEKDKILINSAPSYVKPSLKLGFVPAGSANMLSFSYHGTDDPETSVLQIIKGESHPFDVVSIHQDSGKFVKFSFVAVSIGVTSNLLEIAENMRCFGPARYDIAMGISLVKLKTVCAEIRYLPSSTSDSGDFQKNSSRCRYPCPVCLENYTTDDARTGKSLNNLSSSNHPDSSFLHTSSFASDHIGRQPVESEINKGLESLKMGHSATTKQIENNGNMNGKSLDNAFSNNDKWKVLRGKFATITAYNISGKYRKAPDGIASSVHLADGTNDLFLVRSETRADFLRVLRAVRTGKNSIYELPFTEFYRIKGMHFKRLSESELNQTSNTGKNHYFPSKEDDKPFPTTSNDLCLKSDSQNLKHRNVIIWVHRALIDVFAKGVEQETK